MIFIVLRDTVLMSYYGARSLRYGHYRAEKSAKIGQGFLMVSYTH